MAKKVETEQIEETNSLDKEAILDTREQELNAFADTLNEKEQELNAFAETLKEKEVALSQREAEIMRREQSTSQEIPTAVPVVEGLDFEFNGEKYKFRDDAPQKIRIFGQVMSQEEIVKDEDLLLQLVAGESSLIEKK